MSHPYAEVSVTVHGPGGVDAEDVAISCLKRNGQPLPWFHGRKVKTNHAHPSGSGGHVDADCKGVEVRFAFGAGFAQEVVIRDVDLVDQPGAGNDIEFEIFLPAPDAYTTRYGITGTVAFNPLCTAAQLRFVKVGGGTSYTNLSKTSGVASCTYTKTLTNGSYRVYFLCLAKDPCPETGPVPPVGEPAILVSGNWVTQDITVACP